MILLKSLLAEISLSSVQPYATQFVWRDKYGTHDFYIAEFEAEGNPIQMTMNHFGRSAFGDSGEWQFAYFVRSKDGQRWTTSAGQSAAAGAVNVLRIMKTVGLAIRNFAETRSGVDVIDVSGGDAQINKELQKSAIYANFLRTNPDLSDFRVEQGATRLFLVRKNIDKPRPDASGIDTPGDPSM
jgi:hypothetical protein